MSNRSSSRKDKEALALHRQGLKAQLWKERVDKWQAGGIRPAIGPTQTVQWPSCAWCGFPIYRPHNAVMHEVFIKRSELPIKMQIRIMHKYNCVLAHYYCHEKHGQTREFKLRCARSQYQRYGREAIAAWVESLDLKQHVEIPLESEE